MGGRGKPVSTTASVTWMALQGHLLTFEQWCKLHSNMTAGQPLIASKLGTS